MAIQGMFTEEKVKPDKTLSNLVSLKREMEEVKRKIDAIKLDTVSVDNFDEIKMHLRIELGNLANKVAVIIQSIRIPTSIKVSNFPKQLDTIKIEEIKQLIEAVNDLRAIMAQVEYNPTINVEAPKIDPIDIKIPPINVPQVPAPQIKVSPIVDIDLSDLLEALKPLRLLSNKPTKPITVRMSDGAKWARALKETGSRLVHAVSTAPGMSVNQFRKVFRSSTTASSAVGFKITVAATGSPQVLGSAACYKVQLTGDTDAGIVLVVGGSNAVRAASGSKNGIVIIPGNSAVTIEIDNLSRLWVDAESNGGVLCGVYYTR